jgi:cell division protein FtsB
MSRPAAQPAVAVVRRRFLRTFYWFLAASVLFNLVFGEMGLVQGFRQRTKAHRLEREVASLETSNAALMSEIDDLRNNPHRIESIARRDLGLCRPGEIVFLFPDAGTDY